MVRLITWFDLMVKVGIDLVFGKHLVICCVSLPILEGDYYFHSLVTAYSELSRERDFEMVLVADVKPGFNDKGDALFNDFFSKLPCLAIPFSESHTRANIRSYIGFDPGSSCPDASVLLIDPNQNILHSYMSVYHFLEFGSEWFPFLQSTIEAIQTQDRVLRFRLDPTYPENIERAYAIPSDAYLKDPLIHKPLSLEELLLCDPSLVLPRVNGSGSVTVSELRNKYVGLYLCHSDLTLMSYLNRALRLRVKREPEEEEELVRVVVYVSLYETIEEMQKGIKDCFEKCNIPTFFHPNNSKVWRRLWRVFTESSMEDELVILPPNNSHLRGELYGKAVVENLGEKGYPFARTNLLPRTHTALRSLTPASLFKGTTEKGTCLIRNGGKTSVSQSEIKGKRLLVYVGWIKGLADRYQTEYTQLCWRLMEEYPKIQAMSWEVVYVPLDKEAEISHGMVAKMPWPVVPFGVAVKTLQLLFPCMPGTPKIIAFESDGRMVSTEIKKTTREIQIQRFSLR